jgi:WD40-like Beta Propeller Repeat
MNRILRWPLFLVVGVSLLCGPVPLRAEGPGVSYEELPLGEEGPHLFAEGVISTPDDEVGGVFSPDGKDFYFAKLNPTTTFPRLGLLCVSHWRDGKWTTPEVMPFSGKYLDFPPRLSPDGNAMFFASTRPLEGSKVRALRIWKVERVGNGWGEPRALPPPVNQEDGRNCWGGSVTKDGTIYFAADLDQPGRPQIYLSRFANGVYEKPEKLGEEINSAFNDYDPYVNADETLLFFASAGEGSPPFRHRPEILYTGGFPYARGDIYVSKKVNGEWTPARHLEHGVNSVADDGTPALTPDEKHLIFSSERSPFVIPMAHRISMREFEAIEHSTLNGHGNIYTIPVKALGLNEKK